MEIAEHIEVLRREGARFAEAAERAGVAAVVAPCPGWTVGDLVRHLGRTHRWATTYVVQGRTVKMTEEERARAIGPMPDDPELFGWFTAGLAGLADALERAGQELDCWTLFPAPSPLAFWSRRQAHETAIHRADAELAGGGEPSPFAPDFAADGVDELLAGIHSMPRSRMRTDVPRVLRVRAKDTGGDWFIHLSPDPPRVAREPAAAPADCTVIGPAAALYLTLWNRGPGTPLQVEGDPSVLDLWAERSGI